MVSVANILICARKRHQFNDNDSLVNDLIDRIDYHSAETISQNNGFYHRECYSNITNSDKIKRAEKRFSSAIEQSSSSIIKPKVGRPSLSVSTEEDEEARLLRSQSTPYDKDSCIICQIPGGLLHKVEFQKTGKNMENVAKQLSDKGFYRRLNTISSAPDAIANDVQYHNK